MSNGEIVALGYVGIEVSDLPGWTRFAREMLAVNVSEWADGQRPPLLKPPAAFPNA